MHNDLMASIIVSLYSSCNHSHNQAKKKRIVKRHTCSPAKSEVICCISRSTELSPPVRNNVVTAIVDIARLESTTKLSSSTLHTATAAGSWIAIEFKALTAPNLKMGLGDERRSCKTIIDECKSLESTSGNVAILLQVNSFQCVCCHED